jgi:hypothetical protein
MKYAKVESGKVVKVVNIPKSYLNISGFDKADIDTKISYGWYPLEITEQDINDWEYFGERKYNIEDNKAVLSYNIESRSLEEYKTYIKKQLKSIVIDLINERYEPFEQLLYALDIYGSSAKQDAVNWILARKNNLDTAYTNIDNAATYEEVKQIYDNILKLIN